MAKRPGNGDSGDARRKRPADGHGGGRGGGYDGGGDGGDGHKKEEGGEHQIFEEMVQRRMGGGPPPSAAAYARAMRLWRQMPGAIGFTAVPNLPDEPPPDGPQGDGRDDGQNEPPGHGDRGDGGAR